MPWAARDRHHVTLFGCWHKGWLPRAAFQWRRLSHRDLLEGNKAVGLVDRVIIVHHHVFWSSFAYSFSETHTW